MRSWVPRSSEVTICYAMLNICLALCDLRATLQSNDHESTSRVILQLLTSGSLLPAALLPTPESMAARRSPVLASFLISLALLIDAVLRVLPCLQGMINHRTPFMSSPFSTSLFIAHLFTHAALLVFTRVRTRLNQNLLNQQQLQLQQQQQQQQQGMKASKGGFHKIKHHQQQLIWKDNVVLHALTIYALSMMTSLAAIMLSRVVFITKLTFFATCVHLLAAIITIHMSFPVLMHNARILLQAAPSSSLHSIRSRREQVLAIDGVIECCNMHIWEETAGFIVGTVSVVVHPYVSKPEVLRRAVVAFEGLVDDLTVQVESWRGP